MAKTMTTSMELKIKTNYTKVVEGTELSTPREVMSKVISDTLASGELIDQAENVWHDQFTVPVGGVTIDLVPMQVDAGAVDDVFGDQITFDQIKCLLIHNHSVTSGEYVGVFGVAQSMEFISGDTDTIRVHPGGILFLWAPGLGGTNDCPTPGAGANDQIELVSGAGTPLVDIVIIGCE